MTIGFFLALRRDPAHYLHAAAFVRHCARVMPGVDVVQFSDTTTPAVPGVTRVERVQTPGPLLDLRLQLYAAQRGDWVFLDTDVLPRADVREVFAHPSFDVALCDRNWPHLPQGEAMLQTMPFNTGVVFTRSPAFWVRVLETWRGFEQGVRNDWMSEQQAVYAVVRSGDFRVRILPGRIYNYPPQAESDLPADAALVHFKGPRRQWLSAHALRALAA